MWYITKIYSTTPLKGVAGNKQHIFQCVGNYVTYAHGDICLYCAYLPALDKILAWSLVNIIHVLTSMKN